MTSHAIVQAEHPILPPDRILETGRVTDVTKAHRASLVDAIADPRSIRVRALQPVDGKPEVQLEVQTEVGRNPIFLGVLPGAHDQFAERLKIPKVYYDRMLTEAPGLLVANLQHWLQHEPDRRLFRMVRPVTPKQQEDAQGRGVFADVRAYLSNGYRALDHGSLVDTLMPLAHELGAHPVEFTLDHKRFRLKLVTRERNVRDILRTPSHGRPDEWVCFGVMITNSETGHAALKVEPIVEVLVCWNGLVVNKGTMRVTHLGARQADVGFMRADTRTLDDAATFLKVRDAVRAILTEESMLDSARIITKAVDTPLPSVPLFSFVEAVNVKMDLTDAELELVKESIASTAIGRSQRSIFDLSQGVTAVARETEDPDRRIELQELGWEILADPMAFLQTIHRG